MNRQPCPSEVRGEASINTVHRHALQDWPKPVKLPVLESLFLQMMKVNDGDEMFKAQSDISGIFTWCFLSFQTHERLKQKSYVLTG